MSSRLAMKLNKRGYTTMTTTKKTLKDLSVKISSGNTKLGPTIPNISLPPIETCRHDAPCKKDCYAMKSFNQYPNVRNAWQHNLATYQKNPTQYFNDINFYYMLKLLEI